MTTLITGRTYPVKEQLKALGGTWDKVAKGWRVPNDKAEVAKEIVNNAPPEVSRPSIAGGYKRSRYQSNITVINSGAELYRNKGGRCEDAPCCGCCNY